MKPDNYASILKIANKQIRHCTEKAHLCAPGLLEASISLWRLVLLSISTLSQFVMDIHGVLTMADKIEELFTWDIANSLDEIRSDGVRIGWVVRASAASVIIVLCDENPVNASVWRCPNDDPVQVVLTGVLGISKIIRDIIWQPQVLISAVQVANNIVVVPPSQSREEVVKIWIVMESKITLAWVIIWLHLVIVIKGDVVVAEPVQEIQTMSREVVTKVLVCQIFYCIQIFPWTTRDRH